MSGEYGTNDEGRGCLDWKADGKLRRVQFPDVSQTLSGILGWSLQARFQSWWQYDLRVILFWKQRLIPQHGLQWKQTNTAETPGRISYEWGLLLSRRSRGNRVDNHRVDNLHEHQLIICSVENQSWASVIGSLNKVLVYGLISRNWQRSAHPSSLFIDLAPITT